MMPLVSKTLIEAQCNSNRKSASCPLKLMSSFVDSLLRPVMGLATGLHLFVIAPWAANQEEDLKDINGRNRDTLLTAWYKHTFKYNEGHTLGLTGGIIDATDYLDENAYSNDEFSQFMNESLVNGPNAFLPSYDIGGVFQWQIDGFTLTGVGMSIGENEDENSFNFYGVQLGYVTEWGPGEGNYRFMINTTTDGFSNPLGTELEQKTSLLFSFDQQLGKIFGLWTRFGWQDDKAAINYEAIYSGGINIIGSLWNRDDDNIGIGYAYVEGGNLDIDKSQVFEIYYRLAFNEYFALTADVQYMKDDYRNDPTFNPNGIIAGLRAVAEF